MLYIFDWDGTLSDSLSRITGSMAHAFKNTGLPVPPEEECRSVIGLGLQEAFFALQPQADQADFERLTQFYRDAYLSMDKNEPTPFYEGAIELLTALKAQGHLLAVATGKNRRGLKRILAENSLEDFFDATRCADETKSKPDPLMLHEILVELDCSASDALMIGDTDFDINMGNRAGIKTVAITHGAHSIERLKKSQPDIFVDHLSEILALELI